MCAAAAQSNKAFLVASTMHRMQILTLRGLEETQTYLGWSEQFVCKDCKDFYKGEKKVEKRLNMSPHECLWRVHRKHIK